MLTFARVMARGEQSKPNEMECILYVERKLSTVYVHDAVNVEISRVVIWIYKFELECR